MEPKKYPEYDENRKRPFFFSLGLAIAICTTLAAFELRMLDDSILVEIPDATEEQDVLRIIELPPDQPVIPKPKAPSTNIVEVDDDTFITDEPVQQETPTQEEPPPGDITQLILPPIIPAPEPEKSDEEFVIVERMPTFNGDSHLKFNTHVYPQLEYPTRARRLGLEGTVVLEILVDENGEMSRITVLKGVNKTLDQAAIDAVRAAKGSWTPGRQRGRPVKVKFALPVTFKLNPRN